MRDAASLVRNVRNSFAEYFRLRPDPYPASLAHLPPEGREEFAQTQHLKVFQTGFSDSFVIGIPLTPHRREDEPAVLARVVNDLHNALLALAYLSLEALRQGIPLRGGVDIGLGVEMFPNEVYGPALLSAYRLESQVAEYPRAAIGETLLEYLSFLERQPQDVPLNQFTASMVPHCRRLICPSPDDGWPMLHFLSPVVMAAPGDVVTARHQAEAWVKDQAVRYRAERNSKLFTRYVRLIRYFQAYPPRPPEPQR